MKKTYKNWKVHSSTDNDYVSCTPADNFTTMRRVGFVQPNFQSGPRHLNAFYLPYTAGILWSYAVQNPQVAKNFCVSSWIFRRDPVEQAVQQLINCDVIFFSLYVWNRNYCFTLAQKIKEQNPHVLTVFGGPELPHRDKDMFTKFPFIDIAVVGEGEQAVQEILLHLVNNQRIPRRYQTERMLDLDIPSPYLTGVFDQLMAQHHDIEWMPTLETDRGCPYKCTFCDWGSMTASKVARFGLERVFKELEWFAQNNMQFLTMTNANFGIFRDRDMTIAEKIVELSLQTGYPTGISVSYAKNSNADVFEIVKKFKSANIQTGFILSLQTTTPHVLENIMRTNMNVNDIVEIAAFGRQQQIPIYTEVIMGLPGETVESWKQNIENILDAGLHNGIDAFFLNMIENAPMMQQVKEYKIKSFSAHDMFYETSELCQTDPATVESVQVILENSSVTTEELLEKFIYTWYILGLHIYGITDILAVYLNKQGVDYNQFYTELIEHVEKHSELGKWQDQISQAFYQWPQTGFFSVNINGQELLSWQMVHSIIMLLNRNNSVNSYVDLVKTYAIQHFDVPEDIANDYATITKHRVKQWSQYCVEPVAFVTNTNLFEYTQEENTQLLCQQQHYHSIDRFNHFPASLDQHIDNIVYGRRRNWGLNLIVNTLT
jgi:tRNA A37 methylthiotransferase MiaB